MTANSTAVRVVTFDDQDDARVAVAHLAARAVQDILYLLDTATGPDGHDAVDAPPDPETSRMYQAFRNWFGPQVGASIQGLVVGPLLSRLSVDADGRAVIEGDVINVYEQAGKDREVSRLRWLVNEIPHCVEVYGELYENEVDDCVADVNTAAQLIEQIESDAVADTRPLKGAVKALLPTVERWYMFAQRGARIMRGDPAAVDALLSSLDLMRDQVAELEAEHRATVAAVEDNAFDDVDADAAKFELDRIEQQISKFEQKLELLDGRRERLIAALSSMV